MNIFQRFSMHLYTLQLRIQHLVFQEEITSVEKQAFFKILCIFLNILKETFDSINGIKHGEKQKFHQNFQEFIDNIQKLQKIFFLLKNHQNFLEVKDIEHKEYISNFAFQFSTETFKDFINFETNILFWNDFQEIVDDIFGFLFTEFSTEEISDFLWQILEDFSIHTSSHIKSFLTEI